MDVKERDITRREIKIEGGREREREREREDLEPTTGFVGVTDS